MTAAVARKPEAKPSPIKVKKIGHLVYEVSDVDRTVKFWTEMLGFTVSDKNEFGMVFLRSGSDHHTIAVMPSKEKAKAREDRGLKVDHLALEVGRHAGTRRRARFPEVEGRGGDLGRAARPGRQSRLPLPRSRTATSSSSIARWTRSTGAASPARPRNGTASARSRKPPPSRCPRTGRRSRLHLRLTSHRTKLLGP